MNQPQQQTSPSSSSSSIALRRLLELEIVLGNLAGVQALLHHHASANLPLHHRPLTLAALHGHDYIIHYLLSGSHPHSTAFQANRQDSHGATPLLLAAFSGHASCVTALLAKGADPNIPTHDGFTPLMAASIHRGHNIECLGVLLDHHQRSSSESGGGGGGQHVRLDVDARDTQGRTALWLAASTGRVRAVRRLLSAGADHTLESEGGWTAFRVAEARMHFRVADILQEAERAYQLSKVRQISDDAALYRAYLDCSLTVGTTTATTAPTTRSSIRSAFLPSCPPYLLERMTSTCKQSPQLPEVRLHSSALSQKRIRSNGQHDARGHVSSEDREPVLMFVVLDGGLLPELFNEVLDMMR